jgi:hypothetical protein
MSYNVKQKSGIFEIVERGTDLVVASRTTNEEARKLARSLNLGSGFNGFTPTFFTLAYPDPAKGNTVQT